MIKSGEKKEEYREIKPHFQKLFKRAGHIHINHAWWPFCWVNICFSNGYSKDRDQFNVEIIGMRFESEGNPDWGAIPGKKYFVLELGEIL